MKKDGRGIRPYRPRTRSYPRDPRPVAHITVDTETDTARGWSYHVRIQRSDGRTSDHTVTLSWADHEHWTGGSTPPSRVIETLASLLAELEGVDNVPTPLPPTFDAATAARWSDGLGDLVAQRC